MNALASLHLTFKFDADRPPHNLPSSARPTTVPDMVLSSSIVSVAAALVALVGQVNAHGYMYIPLAEFTDSETSAWVVQIEPQWSGDWDSCSSDDSDCLTTLYSSLKSSNGYSDIRTLLDSDTSLYGADCGFTNPDATAKDPPTTGDATFSRGMVHVGPCEIWLDDTKVLSNDNCLAAYGDGTQDTASVFTPVDYSSCSSSGCMLRFYWLAFQGVDSSMVWQVYKNCVPLTGPAGGTSTTTSSTSTGSTTTESSSTTNESSTTESSSTTTTSSGTGQQESTSAPESSTSEQESTSAPESSTSEQESTSAPESSTSESSQATTSYSFGEQSTEAPSSNSEESKKSDEDESDKKSDEDESDKKSDGDDDNDDDRQRLRQ